MNDFFISKAPLVEVPKWWFLALAVWGTHQKQRDNLGLLGTKQFAGALILTVATCVVGNIGPAEAQLHWPPPPKKEPMRVRLVAVALADPRSSFFSSHEVLVAETEFSHDEWKLIKLVYTFLPYQPRLTETGFDYAVVHELSAWRDTTCDETMAQLTARDFPNRPRQPLTYAHDAPRSDLDRRRIPLPCYETTADDYGTAIRQPIPPPPPPTPQLKTRPQNPE